MLRCPFKTAASRHHPSGNCALCTPCFGLSDSFLCAPALSSRNMVRVHGALPPQGRRCGDSAQCAGGVAGISVSGKSSLAFGTVFAEVQRRYLESVAPYARRLIAQASAPQVGSMEGLPPAAALQQQCGTPNTRSSVGSVTAISTPLRLLFSQRRTLPARPAHAVCGRSFAQHTARCMPALP